MSALAIALIAIGSPLGYMIGCGVTYAIGKERGWKFDTDVGPFFAVVLWPLLLPAALSASTTRKLIAGRAQKQLPEPPVPEARVVER